MEILTSITSIATSVSLIASAVKQQTEIINELKKEQNKRILEQKYSYFLPFKYCADEFRRRITHIKDRLGSSITDAKHKNMITRFQQDFYSKPIEVVAKVSERDDYFRIKGINVA